MHMIYFFGEIPLLQKQFYYFTRHSKTRLGCAVEPLIGESSWCRMRPKPRIEVLLLRHRIPLTVMRLLFLFPFAVPPQRKGQRHEHPQNSAGIRLWPLNHRRANAWYVSIDGRWHSPKISGRRNTQSNFLKHALTRTFVLIIMELQHTKQPAYRSQTSHNTLCPTVFSECAFLNYHSNINRIISE